MTDYLNKGNRDATVKADAASVLGATVKDGDGKQWMCVYAGTTLTAGSPYMIIGNQTNASRVLCTALTSAAVKMRVAVPDRTLTAADIAFVQVGGDVDITVTSATYTAARGLKIDGGAVADSGAAYTGLDIEFAVVASTQLTPATTTCHAILLGRENLSET